MPVGALSEEPVGTYGSLHVQLFVRCCSCKAFWALLIGADRASLGLFSDRFQGGGYRLSALSPGQGRTVDVVLGPTV
jgi:hypothetical protein